MRHFLAFSALVAVCFAQTSPLIFDCNDRLSDVCTNMCWGAYCVQPTFGSVLTYDNYGGQGSGSSIERGRRKTAGCGAKNRCSTMYGNPRAGENCDEYPFASTSQAMRGDQVSRCVISKHNSRQGGIISGFVKKYCNNMATCRLQIDFGNPGAAGVRFCDAYTDPGSLCINDVDPQIYQGDMPAENFVARKRSVAEVHHGRAKFLLASGMKVDMPATTILNSTVARPVAVNETMKAWVEENDEDEELIEWDFVDDLVVVRLE